MRGWTWGMTVPLLWILALACSPPEDSSPVTEAAEEVRAPEPGRYNEEREPCAARFPLRKAFFGELHVHTQLSMDAFGWDVRGTPDDAYRFARGEVISLAPLDAQGRGMRSAQLERPLDFAAITDHAAFLGEVSLCTRSDSPVYDSPRCRVARGEVIEGLPSGLSALLNGPIGDVWKVGHEPGLCGEGGVRCREETSSVWAEIQAAAERWDDRSSRCEFTAFHAYEYTATPDLSKVHRNVIFRNANVPALPISWLDEPTITGLWRALRAQCLEAGIGCDVLTIPHNSNLSNGRVFTVGYRNESMDEQRAQARLQSELEPLVEIMQIKGDSECRNGMVGVVGGADELCDFEKIWSLTDPLEDCGEGTGKGALARRGCVSRRDFVRYALVEGLREEGRIGVNPYKLGIIASTDAHNTNPGDAEEYSYSGWGGTLDDSFEARLEGSFAGFSNSLVSPGGVVGVWAEENSRDSLFDAMQRRETFGTSGPRMTSRFFGGWSFPENLCESADLVERGYAEGVSMGGDLPEPPAGAAAPTFAVAALRDPGTPEHPGGLLQRAQVIKGWSDEEGQFHQAVYDVAGEKDNGAGVDLDTCTPTGPGASSLCAVWTDPDFDPDQRAVYYARVVENPSCRWNQHQCVAAPAAARPARCDDPDLLKVIQERLWTSPIWYTPTPG